MFKHTSIETTMARTLDEVLRDCGFTHKRSTRSETTAAHDIFDSSGAVVFSGRADQVWDWLSLPHDGD